MDIKDLHFLHGQLEVALTGGISPSVDKKRVFALIDELLGARRLPIEVESSALKSIGCAAMRLLFDHQLGALDAQLSARAAIARASRRSEQIRTTPTHQPG